MKINELPWQPHPNHLGDRATIHFPNGYGASILRGGEPYTYTANGTYELAVLRNGEIVYDTSIASDVLANITATEVETALDHIASLSATNDLAHPPAPRASNTEHHINELTKARHKIMLLALKVEEQKLTIKSLVELCDELRQPLNNTRYHSLYQKACDKLNALEERDMI
jgi:hypothetical protein